MKLISKIISFFLILSFIMPLIADARAGYRSGGGSFRSSPGGFNRSYSRPYQGGGGGYYRPQTGTYRPRTNYTPYGSAAAPTAGMYQNRTTSSFFSGLASGLLGAWLYSKFFGGQESAKVANTNTQQVAEKKPTTSSEGGGGFWRVILLLAAVFFIWRLFRSRRNRSNPYQQQPPNQQKMNLSDYVNLSRPEPERFVSTLSQEDHNAFERLLQQIQYAWAKRDLSTLQQLTTPEVFENFKQILQENEQQGISSNVSQVRLINQELEDMWQEGNETFARVALTWSAIDYVVNNKLSQTDPGYLVDGDMNKPVMITEIWTFAKTENMPWQLADIQQT